jgi:peptidoglycan/xylan/chitin deacetylase (PgdA/CDA1 family)
MPENASEMEGPPEPTNSYYRRLIAVLLVVLIWIPWSPPSRLAPGAVTVNGRRIDIAFPGEPLRSLVQRTGIPLPQGEVHAIVSGHVVDHQPGLGPRVLVNGRPADLESVLRAGDRVTIGPGSTVERTEVTYASGDKELVVGARAQTIPAGTVPGTEAGMPDVEHKLWRPGRGALRRVLVGGLSHEVVADLDLVPAISPAEDDRPLVALTFDDGPDPSWTPQVLSILQEEGIAATFCLVGTAVRAHPDLVAREHAQGDALCDHTMTHDAWLPLRPQATITREIAEGAAQIAGASGVRPQLYRPPAGRLSPAVISTAMGQGMRVLFWTIDTSDYLRPSPGELVQRVLTQVTPGSIILFHDGGGDRSSTVAALRPLIQALRQRGYGFTTPAAEAPPALSPALQPPIEKLS